ncbi:hypothetical protein EW146_g5252 [Bondarzewia mesenterica]|uniref:Enoyl reductase (ER) domain-containing protein n=1 Tax=Bondarzewia mesenterica TaxID=1095465 RepID=A0A4S4LT38_9AGAM|nr:hypothetical protein EW146_g5252 [Bondarzewia mesenterica]
MPSVAERIPTRQKAVVVAEHGQVQLTEVDVPRPGSGQILVKVEAAAQSSSESNRCADADSLHAGKTLVYARKYGAVLGCNFAGTVVEIGVDVSEDLRTVGERVAGFVHGGGFLRPQHCHLMHRPDKSEYVVASADIAIAIPSTWTFENAAQLGVAPFAASQFLCQTHHFSSPSESDDENSSVSVNEDSAEDAGPEMLLVFGGATLVGLYTLQLAKLSGLRVLAACAPKHFDLLREFGADEVFDYTSPDTCMTIRAHTGGRLKRAVDVISEGRSAFQVSLALGPEGGKVAVSRMYTSPRPGVDSCEFPAHHSPTEEDIARGRVFARHIADSVGRGILRPIPAFVLPDGLASVSRGLDMMMEGNVSVFFHFVYALR